MMKKFFKENNLITAVLTTFGYFVLEMLLFLFSSNFTKNFAIKYIISYILTIIIYIFRHKYVIKDIKNLKQDFLVNKKNILKVVIIGTTLVLGSSLLLTNVFHITSTNELLVEAEFYQDKILMSINIILLAPIAEELIFRGTYKDVKNKKGLLILSTIVFALIHITSTDNILSLLYIIPYLIMSYMFSYCMYKTNNSIMSIIAHIGYNLINIVILFI